MEFRDLIVTPVVLFLVYLIAYVIRPRVSDKITQKFFFPALHVKVLGALALGFLYQFYYSGGDTFNFHTHGSRHVWEAIMDNPLKGLRLLFTGGENIHGLYKYTSKIPFYNDPSSYMVIRIAAFFDLFTFSTYSATALCFAFMSFIGSWMLFLTFYRIKPEQVTLIAIATLFVPSVFFWGSGLLKDTVTLASLGVATFLIQRIFIFRKMSLLAILGLLLSLIIIYSIKKYILLCYLPAVLLWIYASNLAKIKSIIFKLMLLPLLVSVIIASGYFAIVQVAKDDARYNLDRIAYTARETAYDIAYWTGRDAGSSYTLGELDGSFQGLLKLAPEAINVSMFRPYLWEVRNPLMLMSALESFALLLLTIYVVLRARTLIFQSLLNSNVLFCLVFSITFAFAVGVSTFNFGTLSRYKIPMVPFYLVALVFIHDHSKRERKTLTLESTEYR